MQLSMPAPYSFLDGDTVASKRNHEEVTIDGNVRLKLSQTGKFYLSNVIFEFEYLYRMALSSLMPNEYVKGLKQSYMFEKEQTVFYFMKGIFEILKINVNEYKENGKLGEFIRLFCQDSPICKGGRQGGCLDLPGRAVFNIGFGQYFNGLEQRLHVFDGKNHQSKADLLDDLRIKFQKRSLSVLVFRALQFKLKKPRCVGDVRKIHFNRRQPNDVLHSKSLNSPIGLPSGDERAVCGSTEQFQQFIAMPVLFHFIKQDDVGITADRLPHCCRRRF